jgi:glycosyltransferase involved in cell wall biosynthesis
MIQCIIEQSYLNIELLVIDDAPAIATHDMVAKYANKHSYIKYVPRNRVPKGAQTCRNTGLQMATGEYVCFFDDDDYIPNACIKARVNAMMQHPESDFCVFPSMSFVSDVANCTPFIGISTGEDPLISFLNGRYQFVVWTNMYRKQSLYNVSWDENVLLFQDFDFCLSTLVCGLKYRFIEDYEASYYYRSDYNDSTICSKQVTREKFESTLYLFHKVLSLLDVKGLHKYRKYFHGFIIMYYKQIFVDNNKLLDDYLSFLQNEHLGHISLRLKLISSMFLFCGIQNKNVIRRLMYLFFFSDTLLPVIRQKRKQKVKFIVHKLKTIVLN